MSSSDQKSHWLEKIFRLAIPAGLIWGGIKLFNYMAPTLITAFQNFWVLCAVGIPAVFLIMYVVSNPMLIWMTYKNICHKITGLLIKLDFLSYMDRYVDILKEKRKNLQKSKQFIAGKKVELQRKIDKLTESMNQFLKLAKAAKQLGDNLKAGHNASLAGGDKETLELYIPMLRKLEANLLFLDKLDTNWGYGIEKLEHEVNRLRTQYQTMSEMAKAVGQAAEFANGDTEEAKVYKMSVAALEESLSQKVAAIEEFEKNSKNIMGNIDLEQQVQQNEGMDLLDQYMANNSTLFLPEDFGAVKDIETKLTGPNTNRGTTTKNNEFSELLKN